MNLRFTVCCLLAACCAGPCPRAGAQVVSLTLGVGTNCPYGLNE
jgi:hypothetical protein